MNKQRMYGEFDVPCQEHDQAWRKISEKYKPEFTTDIFERGFRLVGHDLGKVV